jgi:transcriptional regulator GlxA family with amidase domain
MAANCTRDDVRVDEMAAAVGVSRRQLQVICRKQFGRSPMRLLADTRLHRVREAMARPETAPSTVAEAAAMAGYGRADRFKAAWRARYREDPRLRPDDAAAPSSRSDDQVAAGPAEGDPGA